MLEWLESVAGPEYVPAILWTAAALALLVVVLVIVRLIRRWTFGTFVAGGRNRKTRLAVMDATAVDSHRRLVLVRRDDIEHLLLIGGPTDVVVERDIRLSAPRRPAMEGQQTVPPQRPRQPQQAPAAPARQAPPPSAPPRAREPLPPLAPSLQAPRNTVSAAPQPAHKTPVRQARPEDDLIDDELMRDLDFSLSDEPPPQKKPQSLDDEMAKLLGELSTQKR